MRSPERFEGTTSEPNQNVTRRGNIPGSRNIYYKDLINEGDGTLKNRKELTSIFDKANIDTTMTTMCTSGSGITSCILDLALRSFGNEKASVYIGSWAQYVRIC